MDTLHLKNLLYLGEDRYLTTLVLKHFPDHKTQFVQHAKSLTLAPDSWKVLLSQRRRWINSTVHNLVELLKTPQLCGFCLFSMRFIVLIDLLSTIIAPVTIGYLVYLVVVVAVDGGTIPMTSVILLVAIYGLQAVIFLLHRRFDMIGWMIVYILGLPLWSLILPLYSFWHMDDFSWGNTRIVTGEHGEKLLVHQEGSFDAKEIPHRTWEDYENELWTHRNTDEAPQVLREPSPTILSHDIASTMKAWPNVAEDATSLIDDAGGKYASGVSTMDESGLAWPDGDLPMQPTHTESAAREAPLDSRPAGRLPPNEIIRLDIRRIIASSDLTTITKRQLRAQLQDMYGCPIDEKKAYINTQIEAALRDM